jgi:hypothetical protein
MPSTTEDDHFVPDIIALMRHVPGQEDTAGLEAAAALTDRAEFLERMELCARTLRPLIQKGGIIQLPRMIGGDQARAVGGARYVPNRQFLSIPFRSELIHCPA